MQSLYGANHSLHATYLRPSPTWYFYTSDGAEPLRLLDDEGRAEPALSGTPQGVLAELAEAIHSNAHHLGERELRHLELFVALQRWLSSRRAAVSRLAARPPEGLGLDAAARRSRS